MLTKKKKYEKIEELRELAFDKEIIYYIIKIHYFLKDGFKEAHPEIMFYVQEYSDKKYTIQVIKHNGYVLSDHNSFIYKNAESVFNYDEVNYQGLKAVRGYIPGEWEKFIIECGKKARDKEKEIHL